MPSLANLSPGWVIASLLVGTVGLGLFLYGKKETRLPQLGTGLVLMLASTFAASTAWMLGVAGAALGALWLALRAGL